MLRVEKTHTQNTEDPRLGKIINISYSGVNPEAVVC